MELNKHHGNLQFVVASLRLKLNDIQTGLVHDRGNDTLICEEQLMIHDLNKIIEHEESLMRQKSRIKWLRLGDGTTPTSSIKQRQIGIKIKFYLFKIKMEIWSLGIPMWQERLLSIFNPLLGLLLFTRILSYLALTVPSYPVCRATVGPCV